MEYDKDLYKKIANLKINKFVQVSNKKGWVTTINIKNITDLDWSQLQLLVPGRGNRFHKMYELYKFYVNENISNGLNSGFKTLAANESKEISDYINIFKSNGFTEHFQVNNFITENALWSEFKTIRSINDHGLTKGIPGIQPKYFNMICKIINIQGGNGSPLVGFSLY